MRAVGQVGAQRLPDAAPAAVSLAGALLLVGAAMAGCAGVRGRAPPDPERDTPILYPSADPRDSGRVDWRQVVLTRLPRLTHGRGGRWPLTLWEQPEPAGLDKRTVTAMLERGIAPVLPLKRESIPVAAVIQAAGGPVILRDTRGAGSVWPYDLAGDENDWALQFPPDADIPETWRHLPSPLRISGWAKAAAGLRAQMRSFQQRGVKVDAVWLDDEGEPLGASYQAAKAATDSRDLLPRSALISAEEYRLFTRRLWMQLLSAYIAAPIREVYPEASVTNWIATLSLPERPLLSWDNRRHPPMGATLFTASNPVAYGIDTAFLHNAEPAPASQLAVDRIYMAILLRQVSADSYARERLAREVESVPWVARWVVDHPDTRTPMMSRGAYREALRHLWLRGVDAMQVFNPVRKGYDELAIQEVEDAARVYDEMLGFRQFLDRGQPITYEIPDGRTARLVWSGLRLKHKALVRAYPLSGRDESVTIQPWPGSRVKLDVSPAGSTYLLQRQAGTDRISVHEISRGEPLPAPDDQSLPRPAIRPAVAGPDEYLNKE